MLKAEKITVNLNVVDLGKIDLLVEEGFYSNRTDLIKTAGRNQISENSEVVDRVITDASKSIGIQHYQRKNLEKIRDENKMLDITTVGLFSLANDINAELTLQTIKTIKVLGVFRASTEIKAALKDRIR